MSIHGRWLRRLKSYKMTELPVGWAVVIQRIGTVAAGAMLIGGGSMLLSNNTETKVHEQRIDKLEQSLQRIPDIDRNVVALSGKIDVLAQKIDDQQKMEAVRPK
jgi:hypothetical protein